MLLQALVLLAVSAFQDATAAGAQEPIDATTGQVGRAEVPGDLKRWLEEVDELRDRDQVDGARQHLSALLESATYAALLEEAASTALAGLEAIDRRAESLGFLAAQRVVCEELLQRLARILEPDHPDLLAARQSLAVTMKAMGDIGDAHAHFEAVLASRERSLPEDHPDLLRARQNLAVTTAAMGDLPGARALFEAVLAVRERTLPEDHPELVRTRQNLAVMMKAMGDLRGARALAQEVLAARERTLPEDHRDLLAARLNLAATMYAMGDLAGAHAHFEAVLAGFVQRLPEGHPDLLGARQNLALTGKEMGDLPGARALEEVVLAARERSLPDSHPDLLGARQNLALTMKAMGDLPGARALEEAVLAMSERSLPDGHPDLLAARLNLAGTMKTMGDLREARTLYEAVLAGFERRLPEGHPRLLVARQNLALTLQAMGDLSGARALEEAVLEVRERSLPEDHPDLLGARQNLAVMLKATGDLDGARALEEAVLAARERSLPDDHPDLLTARQNLAVTMKAMGDPLGARALGLDLARGMLDRLALASALSPREAREAAGAEAHRHSLVRCFTDLPGSSPSRAMRFDLAESLRVAACATVRSAEQDDLGRQKALEVRARLNDLVSGGPREGHSPESFAAEVARLTFERDRLLREIRASLAERGIVTGAIQSTEVAGALPVGTAAVGFMRYMQWDRDPETSSVRAGGDVFAAHVLLPDGSLIEIELGPANEIASLADSWRTAIGAPLVGRGVGNSEPGGSIEDERSTGRRLRERLLGPVLEAAGEATQLFVCLDDLLFTLPLEALPAEEGASRLGDRVRIVHEVSFARLLSSRSPLSGDPDALLVGDVNYDAEGAADRPSVSAAVEVLRSGAPGNFRRLAESGPEAEAIAERFLDAVGHEPVLLSRKKATKAAFHEHAPSKRFVHVATHGWFAPETIPSTLDAESVGDGLWGFSGAQETVTGLAPMTLCGLAFAGASHGRDSLGRVPGIMTAEELAGVDLSACELAVLSACETNVGIRRAGQGIQSLQTALHAAGAGTAITSLWKVDDAATRKLMERLYTYLWVEEMGKADALWKAKCDLRAEGHPVRDWAAWVLSGDPD